MVGDDLVERRPVLPADNDAPFHLLDFVVLLGWENRPSLHEVVADKRALLDRLDSAGFAATARLQAGELAASGEQSAGVALVGLDPARDAKVLTVHEAIGGGPVAGAHRSRPGPSSGGGWRGPSD